MNPSHLNQPHANRLTISLSASRYSALKTAAAQRAKTMGQLIDESLDFYGIKPRHEALALVQRARAGSQLDDDKAVTVALNAFSQVSAAAKARRQP